MISSLFVNIAMVGYIGTSDVSEHNEIDMDQNLLVIQLKKNGYNGANYDDSTQTDIILPLP